jgi:MFS family permease
MDPDARRTRVAVAAAFVAQGLGFAMLLTHLPAFKDKYDVNDTFVTIILFAVSVLAAGGTAVATWLSAQRGSGLALRLSLATIGLAVAVIAVAPGVPLLCVGFVIYGVGVGGVDASMNMQAVALEHRYGHSILTSFHSAWSAAGIVGALATYLTKGTANSLTPVLLVAAAAILAIAVGVGGRLAAVTSAVGQPGIGSAQAAGPAPAPWRPVLLLGAAVVCFYVADSGTSSWSSIYLHEVLHTTTGAAALAYSFYTCASLLSRLAGDHVVRRIGAATVVRGAGILGAIGLAIVVAAPSAVIAILGFTVLGLGIGVVAPLSFAAAGELSPGNADAVVAQVNVFNYVGFVLGGVVVGIFGSAGVLRAGFAVPLVLSLAIVALAPAFHPRAVQPALGADR